MEKIKIAGKIDKMEKKKHEAKKEFTINLIVQQLRTAV